MPVSLFAVLPRGSWLGCGLARALRCPFGVHLVPNQASGKTHQRHWPVVASTAARGLTAGQKGRREKKNSCSCSGKVKRPSQTDNSLEEGCLAPSHSTEQDLVKKSLYRHPPLHLHVMVWKEALKYLKELLENLRCCGVCG